MTDDVEGNIDVVIHDVFIISTNLKISVKITGKLIVLVSDEFWFRM
jgi:hypothetical protein